MQDGESMYIYFRADNDLLEKRFASKPTAANAAQVAAKLAEKRTKIGGIEFVQVKATRFVQTLIFSTQLICDYVSSSDQG